jgi:hypothetical protein
VRLIWFNCATGNANENEADVMYWLKKVGMKIVVFHNYKTGSN